MDNCKECDEKLGIHKDILLAVFAEYNRQGAGGKLQPSTTMLKSMLEAKLRNMTPAGKAEVKTQILEVMAAALRLGEAL